MWKISAVLGLCLLFVLGFSTTVFASHTTDHPSPRRANYFLNWNLTETEARDLARWDLVVMDMEIQHRHPDLLAKMRQWNPNITMLVYITPQEIRADAASSGGAMRAKLASGISDNWYLYGSGGNRLSWWQGTHLFNVTNDAPMVNRKRLNTYMADFVVDELLSTGYWDGVFYDNSWDNITWFVGNDIDLSRTGSVSSNPDAKWREGMRTIYTRTRERAGVHTIVVGNGQTSEYADVLNGKMLENFSEEKWTHFMQQYEVFDETHRPQQINIINNNTGNSGGNTNYRDVRFGLGSSLMEDGYYSYDFGDQDHGQLWWYDEYEVNLGDPLGDARSKNDHQTYQPDIWQRDFDRGAALLNSTNESQWIDLGGEYEKIHGSQDPSVNDGSIITETVIDGYDGLILLKTFSGLENLLFTNGAFVRFFRPDGSRVRNGFFVFDEEYKGRDQIAHIDIDGNGNQDLVVVSGSKLMVWRDDGQPYMKVFPYTARYTGSLNVTIVDMNGDGLYEFFVSPGPGDHKLPLKAYSRHGISIADDWYPFGEGHVGEFHTAVGEVMDVSPWRELIVSKGDGHAPLVRVYDGQRRVIAEWYAFGSGTRGGASVASGDVDGDGKEEIVAGAGPGNKPVVRIFDLHGNQKYPQFTAFQSLGNPGIDVRLSDVDFDGKMDIIGMSEDF